VQLYIDVLEPDRFLPLFFPILSPHLKAYLAVDLLERGAPMSQKSALLYVFLLYSCPVGLALNKKKFLLRCNTGPRTDSQNVSYETNQLVYQLHLTVAEQNQKLDVAK
jgi:hypothetical protein